MGPSVCFGMMDSVRQRDRCGPLHEQATIALREETSASAEQWPLRPEVEQWPLRVEGEQWPLRDETVAAKEVVRFRQQLWSLRDPRTLAEDFRAQMEQ